MNCKHSKYFQLTVILFMFTAGLLSAQERVNPRNAPVSAAPLWQAEIGYTVRSTPHLQASSAVLAGEDGRLRAFYMSGTPLWDFDARGRVVPYIVRSFEAVSYISNTDGIFMAVNRVGRELWRIDLGRPISFAPVVGWDGRVFIFLGSTIICRTASGNSLWTLDLGSPIAFAPILDRRGHVATVLQNFDFVTVGPFSHLERIRLDSLPVMIVSLKDGDQYSYILFYQSGEMEKIIFNASASEGNRLSRSSFRSLPGIPAAAASRGAHFAVVLRDGRTLHMDAQGNILWTRNSHEALEENGSGNLMMAHASVMYDERGIYVITTRGVTGFAPEGRRRFVFRPNIEFSGIPAISDEGLLYAAGTDNILRVYRIDARPRTIPISRFFGPEPEGTYGMGNPPPSPWSTDHARFNIQNQNMMYERIRNSIQSGQIGRNEPLYVAYLMEMIGSFNHPQFSTVRPAVTPPNRVRLIRLLAQIGSRETVPFLWDVFDNDREPSVRRACADAIGIIGIDPTGRSLVSFFFLLSPNNPNIDPQLVLAATTSIARLSRFAGPPLSQEGMRVLRAFTNLTSLPHSVRAQIRNEIDALFHEGLDRPIE